MSARWSRAAPSAGAKARYQQLVDPWSAADESTDNLTEATADVAR